MSSGTASRFLKIVPNSRAPTSFRLPDPPSRPAQRRNLSCKAVRAPEYEVEEKKTYMDEQFWLERPAGPRTGFDRKVLDKAESAPPAELEDMNHFAMEVFDSQLIADFYVKVLGFNQVNRPRFPFDGAWLRGAGVFIHLILADPTVPRKSDNWKDLYDVDEPEPWYIRRAHHHAFAVKDMEAMEKRLKHFEIEYAKYIVPDTTAAQIFLYDPEGNGIELGSEYAQVAKSLEEKGLYNP
ncbi:hypothetical protein WJX74_001550 [Apatococcus lobatus]|uniref:VOC domain-containing protein n=2 Tax=Apatococcus TaxID=904362 RepID=A0AAW1SLQ5_9CHLO